METITVMETELKVGDVVRIENYKGMLHPMTLWLIKETRPDLSLVFIPVQVNPAQIAFTNEHWVENSQLVKVDIEAQ